MTAVAGAGPSMTLVLWRKVRQLLPVYTAIAESFHFPPPPYKEISAIDIDDDVVLRIAAWIDDIDTVSQPHHLRTVLQELDICSSDLCVSTWLQHFISKPGRVSADRDKIDFLLSHYLRMNLPPSLQEGKPNHAAMKAVLEPVLGDCGASLPEEACEVDELIGIAERCRTLAEFEQSGIIRRGRELKLRANDAYFTPPFLLAFTHFNAVVRRECLRLMNSDLKFIGEALDRLEQQGITHIDCTAANWSERESVSELKSKWATWELASKDYSQDFFASLIAFRSSVEEALERCIELSMTSLSQELRSIHALLLQVRTQIDELPRRLGQMASKAPVEEPAPVPAKPVLVWQSSATPSRPVPVNGGVSQVRPNVIEPDESSASAAPLESTVAAPPTYASVATQAVAVVTPRAVAPEPAPVAVPEFPVLTPAEAIASPVTDQAAAAQPGAAALTQILPAPSEFDTNSASAPETPAPPEAKGSSTAPQPVDPVANVVTPPTNADAKPQSAVPGTVDLDAGIARLQKTLSGKRPTAVSIAVAGTRILLTAAEASMFSINDNRYARGVQRAVMMRICLVSALETHSKTHDKTSIQTLVPAGRSERTAMQELIAECKAQKLAREEEILSATAKQLAAMLERAERIAR